MKDRFKFRVWKTAPINKMKYNSGLVIGNNQLFEDDCVLMQCTGLKDYNGNLIYEGDIAKDEYEYENYEVVYNDDTASFRLKQGVWLHEFDNYVAIIGNIYENPELLEVGNGRKK
jgi:hypothetical protein